MTPCKPIIFSIVTGGPSLKGHRVNDGKAWRERNREAVLARRRELYALNPEKGRARIRKYRKENPGTVLAYNRTWSARYRADLRAEMLAAYGSKCICCGESTPEFLQLDHIHNDGHIDRKINKTSAKLWAKLKKLDWPRDRHQLLCANCNFGKLMNGGICPHAKSQ